MQKSVLLIQGSRSSSFWILAFQDLGHGIMTKNQPNLTKKTGSEEKIKP